MKRFISMWSGEELFKMSRRSALSKIGIEKDGRIIQPPICKVCGGLGIEVDVGGPYIQCLDCGVVRKAHVFRDTFFKREEEDDFR